MSQDITSNVKFTGDATGVQEAAKKAQGAIKDTGDATKAMSTTTVAAGVVVADALKKMTSEVIGLAKSFLGAFKDAAGEVRQLQRILGGSAEDMSKMRFMANELGVSVDGMSRGFSIAWGHMAKNDEAAKRLGISMRDAAGNMKPTTQILAEMGDRFNGIKDAQIRAALAKDIFGRGFQELLPLLSQGADGIKKFGDEASEMGLVLTQKDLDASKQMNLAVRSMKASFEGIAVTVGRAVVPIMKFLADSIKDGVLWFRGLFDEGSRLHGVMKAVAPILGTMAVVMITVTAATKAWSIAQKLLNIDLWANPIGLVLLAVVALAGGLIALVKNFEPVGTAVVLVGKIIGTGLGWGINIALKAISGLIDGLSGIMDAGLKVAGFFAKLADAIGGFFGFDTGLEDKVNSVRTGLKAVTNIVTEHLNDWGDTAAAKGGEVGARLASDLVKAIKDLKMPSMPSLPTGDDTPPPPGEDPYQDTGKTGGGGGKNPFEERIKAVKAFFKNLIDASRAGLNELRQNAIEARKQMADAARGVAQSMAESFNISNLAESSFATYNGVDRLTSAFKKRLDTLATFTRNIKRLIQLGLPGSMIADLVNAGPDQGGAAAALIVSNPQSIGEFRQLQAQLDKQSATLGATVARFQYGAQVAAAEAAAGKAQGEFRGYLNTARGSGMYTPTADDLSAVRGNVKQEVTINVTNPKPTAQEIADAVTWALRYSSKVPASSK